MPLDRQYRDSLQLGRYAITTRNSLLTLLMMPFLSPFSPSLPLLGFVSTASSSESRSLSGGPADENEPRGGCDMSSRPVVCLSVDLTRVGTSVA